MTNEIENELPEGKYVTKFYKSSNGLELKLELPGLCGQQAGMQDILKNNKVKINENNQGIFNKKKRIYHGTTNQSVPYSLKINPIELWNKEYVTLSVFDSKLGYDHNDTLDLLKSVNDYVKLHEDHSNKKEDIE